MFLYLTGSVDRVISKSKHLYAVTDLKIRVLVVEKSSYEIFTSLGQDAPEVYSLFEISILSKRLVKHILHYHSITIEDSTFA